MQGFKGQRCSGVMGFINNHHGLMQCQQIRKGVLDLGQIRSRQAILLEIGLCHPFQFVVRISDAAKVRFKTLPVSINQSPTGIFYSQIGNGTHHNNGLAVDILWQNLLHLFNIQHLDVMVEGSVQFLAIGVSRRL